MKNDDLGNRMKSYYEERSRTYLTRRTPAILRLDGTHFHTFCKGLKKPFDAILVKTMQETTQYLCENIQGCVLGYTQSDEITLVLVDYENLNSAAWFDYQVQKMVSVSASMAAMIFNKRFKFNVEEYKLEYKSSFVPQSIDLQLKEQAYMSALDKAVKTGAFFDARVFNIPKEEVTNCVLFRQIDAERNSILALGQAHFSHSEMQNKNCKQIQVELDKQGIIWGNLPTTLKRGSCCIKTTYYIDNDGNYMAEADDTYTDVEGCGVYRKSDNKVLGTIGCDNATLCVRSHWIIDNEIPRFVNEGREYIEQLINK